MYHTDGPFFYPGPSDLVGKINSPLTLVCGTNLESIPTPNVTWTRNGQEVRANSQYTFVTDERGIRLRIAQATNDDEGHWRCIVEIQWTNRSS